MEKKTPKKKRRERHDEDLDKFKWPAFLEQNDGLFLAQRVHSTGSDAFERRAFTAILRRAYEDVMELEILYRELPGVFTNDPSSIDNFVDILERASERGMEVMGREFRLHADFGMKPIPDPSGGEPCGPTFLVKPYIGFFIGQGIERVAEGNVTFLERHLNTLLGLLQQTNMLDHLYDLALQGTGEEGRDRLAEELRLIARDAGIHGRLPDIESLDLSEDIDRAGELVQPESGFLSRIEREPSWPPPAFGDEFIWPPQDFGTRPPLDICDLIKDVCKLMVAGGIGRLRLLPESTYATGITSISPSVACVGDKVTINGSGFGATQPANVSVLIGNVAATINSWSDTAIVITVPADARSGCVSFLDTTKEAERFRIHQENQSAIQELSAGLFCLGQPNTLGWPSLPFFPSTALCTGSNFLQLGPPTVSFFASGQGRSGSTITVEPNTPVSLSWQVTNATTVQVKRTSASGPENPPLNVTNPPSSIINLGPFTGNKPIDATYELTVTNACGTTKQTVTIRLRTDPVLRITNIEVVQAIQRANNSVPLVARKRTIVRVYVDSGITNGFDNGEGPNLQPNVTGDVTIFPASANQGFPASPPLTIINNVSTGGVVTARPAASINRNNFRHSLYFELPVSQLSGSVRIEARVWVQGHENDTASGWRGFSSTTVMFLNQPTQEVLPFLIADRLLGLPAPTLAQYNVSLQGARTRYPIAQNGFIVNPPISLGITDDLTSTIGWGLLLTGLTTMIFLFPSTPVGGIRTAVVPNDPRYAINGMGVARVLLTVPSFVARAATAGGTGLDPFAGTFAHEMGHSFGVGHAPACLPPGESADGRLPGGTEDTGMDVPTRTLIPSGRGEIMSYNGDLSACSGPPRWPSIAFWNIIFGSLPI